MEKQVSKSSPKKVSNGNNEANCFKRTFQGHKGLKALQTYPMVKCPGQQTRRTLAKQYYTRYIHLRLKSFKSQGDHGIFRAKPTYRTFEDNLSQTILFNNTVCVALVSPIAIEVRVITIFPEQRVNIISKVVQNLLEEEPNPQCVRA